MIGNQKIYTNNFQLFTSTRPFKGIKVFEINSINLLMMDLSHLLAKFESFNDLIDSEEVCLC